jgi:LysM repeat protein
MIRLKTLLSEATLYPKAVEWAKKFQTDLDLTPEAAAAMAANIQHESGFYADRVQGAGIQRDSMDASGNLGYSWAQWTFAPRKKDFRDYVLNKFKVDINKTPATDAQAYSFLKSEIYNYPGFDFNKFKSQTDITKATEQFVSKYEQAGKPMLDDRIAIAQNIYTNIKPVAKPKVKLTGVDWMDNAINSSLYKVKPGDQLLPIANKFGITLDRIKNINGLTNDNIRPGQILKVD